MATFIGDTGGLEYILKKYGPESEQYMTAVNQLHDQKIFNSFIEALYNELDNLYKRDMQKDGKITGREIIFKESKYKYRKIKSEMRTGIYDYFEKKKINSERTSLI